MRGRWRDLCVCRRGTPPKMYPVYWTMATNAVDASHVVVLVKGWVQGRRRALVVRQARKSLIVPDMAPASRNCRHRHLLGDRRNQCPDAAHTVSYQSCNLLPRVCQKVLTVGHSVIASLLPVNRTTP